MKVAVVIPIYKDELNEFEKISLKQVFKVLGRYPIIFFAPEGKNFSYVPKDRQVVYFPPEYFANITTYNFLMLEPNFYATFFECENILIYQLDAFVFSDKLEYFCSLGYDYIGAPWIFSSIEKHKIYGQEIRASVGNGGFCLRRPKACYELLLKHKQIVLDLKDKVAEDCIFALCGAVTEEFKIAPLKVAKNFSIELLAERFYKKNNQLPFGCHSWHKYSSDFWMKIFKNFGYDLTPFKNQLLNKDIEDVQAMILIYLSKRLQNRIAKNLSLKKYLPPKNYFYVRVIDNPFSKKIFQNLCEEDKTFGKNFKFYTGEELGKLLADLKNSIKKNNLIITTDFKDDDFVISALKKNNIKVKDNFVFFHREYLKICEKIFDNLGK